MTRRTVTVQQVIDGDTFLGSDRSYYRLANVDAPEEGQRGYLAAKKLLTDVIQGKSVQVEIVSNDRGRHVCKVELGDLSVNAFIEVNLRLG